MNLETLNNKHAFSPQEIKIIKLISEGYDNRMIGEALNITENTVRTHRKNILRKSDSKNITHPFQQRTQWY